LKSSFLSTKAEKEKVAAAKAAKEAAAKAKKEEAKRLKDEAIAKKKKLAKGAKGDEGDALLRVGKVEDVAGRTRELRRQPSGSGATFCWPPGMVRTKINWIRANCA
jgi:hypothetical protein